jgi:hypothetical protein
MRGLVEVLHRTQPLPYNANRAERRVSANVTSTMSGTPLFHFGLWPVSEVTPWEADGRQRLHWFGLTDGWYTMNCGGTELMRYSQPLIDATPNRNWRTSYFDYQVARLYEDVLDVLPYALDPIPSDLVDLARTIEAERAFVDRSERWAHRYWPLSKPEPGRIRIQPNEYSMFWDRAAGWWLEKHPLSRGHMRGQPDIRFWSEGETLYIRWTNDCDVDRETRLPWNDARDGLYSMSLSSFLSEVRSFHDRLMQVMTERIELARSAWPLPDVSIDIEQLIREHNERTQSLERALTLSTKVRQDWNAVRKAIEAVIRLVEP